MGDTDVNIDLQLFPTAGVQPTVLTAELSGSAPNPQVIFDFGEAYEVKVLKLEVTDLQQGEPAHVHLWEIQFR